MEQFLIKQFGTEKGKELNELINERYNKFCANIKNKSKQQEKVLRNTILPRIAMYQILKENNYPQSHIMKIMDEHMVISAGIPMRKKYDMLDSLPCAYWLFKTGFTKIVAKSDLWNADINKDKKDEFSVTMKKCFWHDTFQEYGCPEICKFACRCDDITYSNLKHIGFHRTQTLGTGGDCCDFKFTKIKK